MFLRDLSVSMEGEAALLDSRERTEAAGGDVRAGFFCSFFFLSGVTHSLSS